MSSQAQKRANKQNAQHSTGPRTDQGKQRTSQNAVKHGFRSKHPVIPGEDPAHYQRKLEQIGRHLLASQTPHAHRGRHRLLLHRHGRNPGTQRRQRSTSSPRRRLHRPRTTQKPGHPQPLRRTTLTPFPPPHQGTPRPPQNKSRNLLRRKPLRRASPTTALATNKHYWCPQSIDRHHGRTRTARTDPVDPSNIRINHFGRVGRLPL